MSIISETIAENSSARGNTKTTRADWLAEARRVLVEEGVDRVKVDRLAKNLHVSRGGFYWFFKNRQDLLDTLLADWQDKKNDPLCRAIDNKKENSLDALVQYVFSLIRERSYSPSLDSAIRSWSRISDQAKQAVETVDNRRIITLTEIFQTFGCQQEEAFIRARIFYFHQVGYSTMDISETHEQRLHYLPIYFKQLTGLNIPEDDLRNFIEEFRDTPD